MGIGNTTTSAAVLMAIAPRDAASLVGYGSARGNFRLPPAQAGPDPRCPRPLRTAHFRRRRCPALCGGI
jgi:hypothetical protein